MLKEQYLRFTINTKRLKRYGHVMSVAKNLLNWFSKTKRARGGPSRSWNQDNLEELERRELHHEEWKHSNLSVRETAVAAVYVHTRAHQKLIG